MTNLLLGLLADCAFEPLILLDDKRCVAAANQAARELFPDRPLMDEWLERLVDSPDLAELLDCASREPQCPEIQFSIGKQVYRARCTRIDIEGRVYLALALLDITQLLRLNRARRDMVANISHELRTPISAIRLLRDTLSRQQIGRRQREKVLRKIGRELDTLQRIVEGMHDLSMIESGQAIMKLVETPLRPLVDEALDHLDEQLARQKLKLEIKIPDDFYVLADPAQIGRVLGNLIHNAIKVTPKKGRLRICAFSEDDHETVTICIDDSGPGIKPEERDRVFERFYQIDESRSHGRGSGLGLSIARHIIEAHNGRIWVEDSDLGGARFCFTLLAAEKPAEAADVTAAESESA